MVEACGFELRLTVACLPERDAAYFDPAAATATLTVVDPEGRYVPWDLACGHAARQLRLRVAAAEEEDPAEVFRRVEGVRPSDELKKSRNSTDVGQWSGDPGYPGLAHLFPVAGSGTGDAR